MAVIELTLDVAAARERVFAALTEPLELEHWFCHHAVCEPRLGGRIELHWRGAGATPDPFVGRWVQFDAHEACAYQGGHAGYPDGDAGTVLFELVPLSAGTQVRVRHTFPDRDSYAPFIATYQDAWPRALRRLSLHLTPASATS